ncbi:MAG: GNAT family N-acetyltransferase [Candidatus Wildermuthbacteria bacterium]|nr:GNAT family N-acetyltransferase [Candidatus Wildermuthbacteria bacterium]
MIPQRKQDIQIFLASDIELKQLRASNAEALFRLSDKNRKHLRRWLPWVDRTRSVKDSGKFIQESRKRHAEGNGFDLGIWHKEKLIGVIGLHNVSKDSARTEIGYWLSKEMQGKGIMVQSCKALIGYLFDELNFHRVEIRCASENEKSCAIPEKLGFAYEGTLRKTSWLNDHYIDLKIYGLLREEWKQKSTSNLPGSRAKEQTSLKRIHDAMQKESSRISKSD